MSLSIVIADQENLYISADSRESAFLDGGVVKLHDNTTKIHKIGNFVIFTCGLSEMLELALDRFRASNNYTLHNLYHISHSVMAELSSKHADNIKNLNDTYFQLIVAEYNQLMQKCCIHAITNYTDAIMTNTFDAGSILTFGIKVDEARAYLEENMNNNQNIVDIMLSTYRHVEFEGVGGNMTVYHISKQGIELFAYKPIEQEVAVAVARLSILGNRILFTQTEWASYSLAISPLGICTDGSFKLYSANKYGLNNIVSINGNGIQIYGSETAGEGIIIKNKSDETVLSLDTSGNIVMKGSITITGGSGIGSLSDAGDLATADDLDDVADGSTYKRTTANEKTGGARGYNALDINNKLTTDVLSRVLPGATIGTPATSGMYMGSDYFGFYDATIGSAGWKVFLRNDSGVGKFGLQGAGTHSLAWDGSTLAIRGSLNADDITAGTLTGRAISGGTILIGTGDNIFKADTNGIYLGNATFASAPFRVTPAGAVTASNITITGGSISVATDASVGNRINIGNLENAVGKGIYFYNYGGVTEGLIYSGGTIGLSLTTARGIYLDVGTGYDAQMTKGGIDLHLDRPFDIHTSSSSSASKIYSSGSANLEIGSTVGSGKLLLNSYGDIELYSLAGTIEINSNITFASGITISGFVVKFA